jgi:ribulose-phosphate 3-epimerase
MDKIRISILDIEISKIETTFQELKRIGIKYIHLDLIDTSFADNISFGISTVNFILSFYFFFDIHFMVEDPLKIISKINLQNVNEITVHDEKSFKLLKIKFPILKIGFALDLKSKISEISDIEHLLQDASHILVMSVNAGFGGQKFNEQSISKIKKLKSLKNDSQFVNKDLIIGVDGGINDNNIHIVRDADFIVVGSFIIKSENKLDSIEQLISKLKN